MMVTTRLAPLCTSLCSLQSRLGGAARDQRGNLQSATDLQARFVITLHNPLARSLLFVTDVPEFSLAGVRDLAKIITLPSNNFEAIDEKVRICLSSLQISACRFFWVIAIPIGAC
jgi:hypothetical protein